MRVCPQCQTTCDDLHKFCPSCGFPIGKVATSAEDPLIGRTLPGGYVILDLVGIGGMGRVYRAEQTNLSRTVAVKIIHPHLVGEENAAARFITEARAASRLNHPNSVAVIDFGKTPDGQLYLVMEFLRGKDLARIAYEEGPLKLRRIVDVLRQVLAALAEAHHLEIIHRDLKPENIILEPLRTGGDFVKVVDFGLAKMRLDSADRSITSPGIVCGTPEYMSPEQGRGDPLDARSDLYAVGVILFQLLTGHLPFEAESPTQVVLMHLTAQPPDPRTIAPDRNIPEPLVEVALRALSKPANDRFRDADDFSAVLLAALQKAEAGPEPLEKPTIALKCTACGALNGPNQKFCGDCGAPTAGNASAPFVVRQTVRPPPGKGQNGATANRPADASPNSARAVVRTPFPLPFLARGEDIEWLEARRTDAGNGLVAARVIGDHGIGKTRLLAEFLTASEEGGDITARTGPDPTWAEIGYYAVRTAIRALANLPNDGGAHREWVGASSEARRGLADIFEKSHSTPPDARRLSPDERRFAAAEAVRWALLRASERVGGAGRRVMLVVDDIQNVDGASRNAFADVICEPPPAPVLLIAVATPGFDLGWPAVANTSRSLQGIPSADVMTLFMTMGTSHVPSFDGGPRVSPLYAEQVMRFQREQGGQPPTRLADLIALRVERLPADARRVLQAVAVLGDSTPDVSLLPLLPPDTDLVEALATLRRAGMIEAGAIGWSTAHLLLREVVLATIPAAVRRQLHAAAAKGSDSAGVALEVQALHAYHAQDAFDALILLEKVSSRCAERGDIGGTTLALRRGLELARRELFRGELDDPMRAVLIFGRKLGEALAQAGDYTDAEGVLREALDMAGPSGQDRARVLGALATVAFGRDRRLEAQVYLREAILLARRAAAPDLVQSLERLKEEIQSVAPRLTACLEQGELRPVPRHIARWDLDKTYLRTEFDTVRDLVRTALERADEKRTNPGASTLLREMVRAGVSVHILSGSPEQMRRKLEDKLRLDGIQWDSFTLKPNLQNLLRLRFRAMRDQLGYKLPALVHARRVATPPPASDPGLRRETLFGDDAEADAFVYSLYGDVLAGKVSTALLAQICARGRLYPDVIADLLEDIQHIGDHDQGGPAVERILIHLERQSPPDEFRIYGARAVPFYNYLQAAFVVHEDGRVPAEAVLRVGVELVVQHRFDGDALARSYYDLVRRGHVRGTGVADVVAAYEQWEPKERLPGAPEIGAMVARLPSYAEQAPRYFREDGPDDVPDYLKLVERHNKRRR